MPNTPKGLWQKLLQPRDPPEQYEGLISLQMKLLRELHIVTADLERIERGIGSMEGIHDPSGKAALLKAADGNKGLVTFLEAVIKAKDPTGKW